MFSSMLQLLLYLCSEEPDMPAIEHPRARTRFSGGYRVQETPRIWDVGVRVSAALRRFGERPQYSTESSEGGSHASPRPHVRSAHWHTYWTGHRDASFPERKPVLRWLPPMPICMDWKHELPTNVRTVAG